MLGLLSVPAAAQAPATAARAPDEASRMREDALSLESLINQVYAYPERLAGRRFTFTPRLRAEARRSWTAGGCCALPSAR